MTKERLEIIAYNAITLLKDKTTEDYGSFEEFKEECLEELGMTEEEWETIIGEIE